MPRSQSSLKYQTVLDVLRGEIDSGMWKEGERLPTEAELIERFSVSRITVGRALRELQSAGLIERRAGSGTFRSRSSSTPGLSFGLLIPDLGETEIFEPICQGMMASPLAREHALLWGSLSGEVSSREEQAWQLCRHYIDRRVSGVFFAPIEMTTGKDRINQRISDALDEANIPVVLLDRTVRPYPERGHHDLVGIDNRGAGFEVTRHLIECGSTRIAIVGVRNAASTVDAREAGYREALYAAGLPTERERIHRFNQIDAEAVSDLMKTRPDGIVAVNDRIAAALMSNLLEQGHRIPDDVALVGIDDLEYAKLLTVPLTTLRQPTRQIGAAALSAMLERVHGVELPTRDILLQGDLIVRKSSGAGQKKN